ncbi:hypothetical protein BpHYR1_029459 [Brachionus plicatilis]|uniref:Uncharacterized protein n=1 Tax=Brachionus plicatilis TaxID=10195 RepID=A0A3M7S265_BRAPC|nr:hypothetical protein BpHYR1_029459 [Brachionus plicatilis]
MFNDPVEEEKQNRIHIEQIKYLSRSIYNYQNQISTLRTQIKKDKGLSSTYQRLIHTMRQIVKLIISFEEIYPYRQDKNAISEKLCAQFYKHLNMSIKNFADCLTNCEHNYVIQLKNLIENCDQFFTKNEEKSQPELVENNVAKENKQSKNKNANQVYNVVRVSRSSQAKNNTELAKVSSKRIFDKKKPKNQFSNVRFEISPPRSRPKQLFQNKKIKTAKLFPSNRALSQSKSQLDLDLIPIKETNNTKVETKIEHKPNEDLSSSLNELEILSKSNDQIFKPAFVHSSSPKLAKIKPILSRSVSRSRSRSAEKLNNKLYRTVSNETVLSDNTEYEMASPGLIRPILKSRKCLNPTMLYEKLDYIRQENDSIRRKYQNLSYYSPGIESFGNYDEINKARRPYQECYLDDNSKPKMKDLECPVTFNKVYKPLNGPNLDQLKRVVKYAEDFENYNKKTSITRIGDSEFDDFELFEILSNDLFEEIFESIYGEIENVNGEVAQNLLNNEFESEIQDENSKKNNNLSLNEYDQSFEQTLDSSKHLPSVSSPQRKSTKTVSLRKTSSKTSTSSNNALSQQNDFVIKNLDEQSDDNIVEDIPDQVNTNFSSIHSNIDESVSSISN